MNQVDGILNRVSGLAGELKLANLQPQIAACRRQFNGDSHSIDVAVFGRFKAGKSSFLNHLTGRAVLPIGIVPLTAVITRLRYGPNERAEVRFLNGHKEDIPLSEIRLYVGEDKNPNNEKQVASVDVELPALQQFDPLQFVDTPGLGSAFGHNTAATRDWLPNVGAALVAISSDAPLSERDLELLHELRQHMPKIVLLLTKADLLDEAQRGEVMDFVRQQLLQKWKAELPVYFYSIRPEERGLKKELEQKLFSPLIQRRDEAAEQIARHKILSLLAQTLNYLRVALAAATQAESSRTALREKLADERRQFDLFREELQVLSHKWSAKALDQSLEKLGPRQRALQRQVAAELRALFPKWPSRLPPLLRTWREWLQDILNRELTEISSAEKGTFLEPLKRVEQHLMRILQALQHRLAGHVQAALRVMLAPHDIILEVPEPAAPPIDIGYLDAAFSTISPLISMSLFRSVIERSLLRRSYWEAEKNLSRLASNWRDRVTAGINGLTRQAEQHASAELNTLDQMLMQTASKIPELKQAIYELEQCQNRLRSE